MDEELIFNELQKMHPDWSDKQIWAAVSIMLSSDDVISASGPNVTYSEDLFRTVLEKAKRWLSETLPDIYAEVADYFNELIDNPSDCAKQGAESQELFLECHRLVRKKQL